MGIINRLSDICYNCPCPCIYVHKEVRVEEGVCTIIECENALICGHVEKYIRDLIAKEKENENR